MKKSRTSWSIFSVLAHEIGHHLNQVQAKNGGGNPESEKRADFFSGFIMKSFGADLQAAQSAINVEVSDDEVRTTTHPAKQVRLDEIKKGWDKATGPKGLPGRPDVGVVGGDDAGKEAIGGGIKPDGGVVLPVPAERPPRVSPEIKPPCRHS